MFLVHSFLHGLTTNVTHKLHCLEIYFYMCLRIWLKFSKVEMNLVEILPGEIIRGMFCIKRKKLHWIREAGDQSTMADEFIDEIIVIL